MSKIKIAIAGLGNCASSLIQGIQYYKNKNEKDAIGLMHWDIGGYRPFDIEVVAGFDVDKRKIGKDISQAIFEKPNCTKKFSDVPFLDVTVQKGPILDGIADHMHDCFQIDENQKELSKEEIISILKESKTDILINYIPVGSQLATEFYAECCLEAGVALINCIPVFIVSDETWANRFKEKCIPVLGDDIKSEVGSTIINRTLVQMIQDRGGKIVNSWQTNFGGNTDFLNMVSQDRLESKKISKTESISSIIHDKNNYIYAGPNGFIECLSDNKISFMRIDFKIFGDIPCSIDLKLSVEDSPNSGGVVIDTIRIAKICLDKGIGGPVISACAWMFKRPPQQMKDEDARKQLEDFINSQKINTYSIIE